MSAFATSYIPTTSASATRAADAVSLATSAFNVSSQPGTLYASAVYGGDTGSYLLALYSATPTQCALYVASGQSGYAIYGGTGSMDQVVAGALSFGESYKTALGFATDNAIGCKNGTLSAGDTSVTPGTPTSLIVGDLTGATNIYNGWIKQIMHLPRRMANADLQTLTT